MNRSGIKTYKAVPFGKARYKLGEGPIFDERTNKLSFTVK